MGAQVLQEDAIFPCARPYPHPHPQHPPAGGSGTLIVPEQTERKGTIVTGIAGEGFPRYQRGKDALRRRRTSCGNSSACLKATRCPSKTRLLHRQRIGDCVQADISGKERKILEEIRIYCSPDALVSMPSIALIAVVGQGMITAVARVFRALGDDRQHPADLPGVQ